MLVGRARKTTSGLFFLEEFLLFCISGKTGWELGQEGEQSSSALGSLTMLLPMRVKLVFPPVLTVGSRLKSARHLGSGGVWERQVVMASVGLREGLLM